MTYTPLASVANFEQGPEADLFKAILSAEQTRLMTAASRAVEAYCNRRLAPFTITENHRAQDIDPDELTDVGFPLDQTAMLGMSRAQSLGANELVRHLWVNEFPPVWPDLWSGSVTAIELRRAFGGNYDFEAADLSSIQFEPEDGHIRLQLGTFSPIGTTIRVTYTGGYSTTPDDLVQAVLYKACIIALTELLPIGQAARLDKAQLQADFEATLSPYVRSMV
jgi:hypothetical protein